MSGTWTDFDDGELRSLLSIQPRLSFAQIANELGKNVNEMLDHAVKLGYLTHGSGIIRFYSKDDPYGFLSNFYPCNLTVVGKSFPSSEHAYQWARGKTPELREWIRQAPAARYAAQAARGLRSYDAVDGWMELRVAWMRVVVWAKFEQNPMLATMLDQTKAVTLIEASPTDPFWGQTPDGRGENVLGRILMAVRDGLRHGPRPEYRDFMAEVPL